MSKWSDQVKGTKDQNPGRFWVVTPKGEQECLLGTLERLSGRRELEK